MLATRVLISPSSVISHPPTPVINHSRPLFATMRPSVTAAVPMRHFSDFKDSAGNIIPIHRETVLCPIKFLPQKYSVLHEQFGRFTQEYNAGFNVFTPLVSNLVYVINTENVYAVTHQDAITKDNASVKADGVIYYKIMDPKKAAYGVSDLIPALENLVVTNLRTVMGNMEMDELLKGREHMNHELTKVLGPAAEKWGVLVTRVEIREIVPDRKLIQAMDQQMIAERNRRATETDAEAKKKATVLGAQAERERLENTANGNKEAAIHEADGKLEVAKREAENRRVLADADAYARTTLADAEAKSIETISAAINKNPGIEKYFIAQGTVEAWKSLAKSPNHKLLLFPSGSSSMVTPFAAAAEMLGLGDRDLTADSPSSHRVTRLG